MVDGDVKGELCHVDDNPSIWKGVSTACADNGHFPPSRNICAESNHEPPSVPSPEALAK
jgi:hypothetical protein